MYKYELKLQEAKAAGEEFSEIEEFFLYIVKEGGLKYLDMAGRFYLSLVKETEDPELLERLKNKMVVATELREMLDETLCRLIDDFMDDHEDKPFEETT